ncbi:cbb3-type cytochrome c oxidase subunit I [Acidianus sp. RZ1]|uniref:cbb3-type cytochrome c oxidase subunit I n=1 Tax=Acidianus sp. RZ1 TaxID=1540082 RepID=UPI001491A319|nr:cbb3-type cytochrome c oxidase subunit I [Acidianus sp. RZ1]NON63629.1 quinol oxidase subunit 1 [Acidianus sp. RZ1]
MSIRRLLRVAFYTTSASDIGQMYILLGIVSLIIGAVNAFLIRDEITYQNLSATDYYNAVTLHGIFMIFFMVMPISVGFANYLIPRMIGAHDLYWPKINALSFWILAPAVLLAGISPWFGPVNTGWYMYAPLSVDKAVNYGIGVNLVEIGLILSGVSSTLTGINFLMTITKLKKVPYFKMSLFTWSFFATSILLVIAMPPLTAGLVMAFLERSWSLPFFLASAGGSAVLWQNLFWFFGHPEVYILILPAMGLIGEILPRMVGRQIYGYKALALSTMAIAFLSALGVWMHHMFTAIDNSVAQMVASATTMAIAVPSGVKVFNWTATLYGGEIKSRTPTILVLSFVALFLVGGITGVFFPLVPIDYAFNGTYLVVGHFHYMVFAILVALLAGLVYYFPYYTGKWYNESVVKSGAIMIVAGTFMIATGMTISGVLGMPRRYAEVPSTIYIPFQNMIDIGGVLMGIGLLALFGDLIYSWIRGRQVLGLDPWNSQLIGISDFNITPRKLPLSFGKSLDGEHEEEYNGLKFPYYSAAGLSLCFVPIGFLAIFLGMISVGLPMILAFMAILAYWGYDQWFKGLPNLSGLSGLRGIKALGRFSLQGMNEVTSSAEPEGNLITNGRGIMRDARTAVLWFILAEIFLFGSFIGGYLFVANPVTNPIMYNAVPSLSVDYFPLPIIMTVILLSSSIPAHLAYEEFKRGKMKMFRLLGGVTALMGFTFLMGQLYEFTHIIHFPPQQDAFTAFFYTTVGLHGFHVIMGLTIWAFILLRSRKVIPFGGSVAATYYWHFVDAVWVVVFSVFYLHLIV